MTIAKKEKKVSGIRYQLSEYQLSDLRAARYQGFFDVSVEL